MTDLNEPTPSEQESSTPSGEPIAVDTDPMSEAEPVKAPASAEVGSAAETPAEPAAESGAKPTKNLKAGRVKAKDDSALQQGVAVTRLGGAAGKSKVDESAAADPAMDEPMYRPGMDWFVLRVASNKENSVRETLLRKVQIEGMEHLVGRIMVPTEKIRTLKGAKPKVTEQKLYPGYVFVEMALEEDGRIPQDVFFLIKETTGVGDFVGTAGRPTPMAPHEVEKMLFDSRRPEELPEVKMEFAQGDPVTINEGPFENYEGTVDEVLPDKGLVRVLVTIFGRQAPIELEYWQIAKVNE